MKRESLPTSVSREMLPAASSTLAADRRRQAAWRRIAWLGAATAVLLLVGAALRVSAAAKQALALETTTAHNAVRSVLTGTARLGETRASLTLPGTLRANAEAALYARTNGYLKSWAKDMGDAVRQGEPLAEIDTPEIALELLQAHAVRAQALSRVQLAETSLTRWQGLRSRDAVPQQEVDERIAARRQTQADLEAADANVKRLEELQSFRYIVAPFDSVVVRRNVEIGALISAGNNGNNRELFHVMQTDPLIVSVAVPQAYAASVLVGDDVALKLAEQPGVQLKGQIRRKSGAVDPDTRAMSIEIELPNPGGKLLPGAYVEATLKLQSDARQLVVPASALQFRQEGPRLALVDGQQRIMLRTVKLGRDFGKTVEVLSGLSPTDQFVLHPHDTIEAGESVITIAATIDNPASPSTTR